MNDNKKIVLSGVKPTARPHVGNYFGAMRQFVDLQNNYDCYFMLADLHAIIFVQNAELMRQYTLDLALDYLAIGLDPKKVTLFKQSDVPAHAETAWIFDCITTMPYLMRAHAYKDAEAKNKEIDVGSFNYPILMAADILLYDTDVLPVGQDQKQHVEYARDIAEKFNRIFKQEVFKLPEPLILSDVGTVPGLDGQKMSKSYGNTIPLFAEDDEIRKLCMSIVTDSKGVEEPKDPETDNVFALHKLFSTDQLFELERRYLEGGIGYKESKDLLAENVIKFITPLRERRKIFAADPTAVIQILKDGAEQARAVTSRKLQIIKQAVGIDL